MRVDYQTTKKMVLLVIITTIFLFLLFISIPMYVVSTPCQILPKPYKTVVGIPWKETPCYYTGVIWGFSIIDNLGQLKCLIQKEGFCFLFGSCTQVYCPMQ